MKFFYLFVLVSCSIFFAIVSCNTDHGLEPGPWIGGQIIIESIDKVAELSMECISDVAKELGTDAPSDQERVKFIAAMKEAISTKTKYMGDELKSKLDMLVSNHEDSLKLFLLLVVYGVGKGIEEVEES